MRLEIIWSALTCQRFGKRRRREQRLELLRVGHDKSRLLKAVTSYRTPKLLLLSRRPHNNERRDASPDKDLAEIIWTWEAQSWLKDIYDYILADPFDH